MEEHLPQLRIVTAASATVEQMHFSVFPIAALGLPQKPSFELADYRCYRCPSSATSSLMPSMVNGHMS